MHVHVCVHVHVHVHVHVYVIKLLLLFLSYLINIIRMFVCLFVCPSRYSSCTERDDDT